MTENTNESVPTDQIDSVLTPEFAAVFLEDQKERQLRIKKML